MPYPFWDQPLGHGVLMAMIAVFHVFIAHFAIGGGLYLVVSEHLARRRQDQEWLSLLEELSRFFLLTTLVLGALSGVGIWFVIGLLNPAGTEALIRLFVWAWATEWTFFVIEITAAILYYYGWKRLAPRAHLTLGWIYFLAAWMSLAVINGIVTFMLTPGEWLKTGDFWQAFFNPTFWPSLVLRTGIALTLAGLYVTLALSRREHSPFRTRQIRLAALWGLAGLAVSVPAMRWYWLTLPAPMQTSLIEQTVQPMVALRIAGGAALALGIVFVLFGLAFPKRLGFPVAVLAMALGFVSFGGFEWFREAGRKPFVIPEYMYATGLTVAGVEPTQQSGLLPTIRFQTKDEGADLFRYACQSCHTLRGPRALGPFADGLDHDYLARLVQETGTMKGKMPPFPGSSEDASKLAKYLVDHSDRRPLETVTGLEGATLGKEVWRRRCATCHQIGGFRDCWPTLSEMSREEIAETLGDLEMYSDQMPAFTASEVEREAMLDYLASLQAAQKGEAHAASQP